MPTDNETLTLRVQTLEHAKKVLIKQRDQWAKQATRRTLALHRILAASENANKEDVLKLVVVLCNQALKEEELPC